MAARTQPPPKDSTALITAAAIVLAVGACVLSLPGAAIAWLGLIVAGWMAPAPVFTGKKDKAGRLTPAHPGEARAMRTYRLWADLRWRLLVPTSDWLPGWPVLAAWVSASLAGVAVSALQMRPGLPWFVPAINGALAFMIVAQVTASRRRFAVDDDQCPGVRFDSLPALARSSRLGMLTVSAAPVLGMAAAAVVVLLVPDAPVLGGAWGPWALLVLAACAGLATTLGVLTPAWTKQALTDWRELVAAREQWKVRWDIAGLKDDSPFLVEHVQVGAGIVETFDAPPSSGAVAFINGAMAAKVTTALGTNMRVAILETPNLDGQGQPVPGSQHPVRFEVVIFPADQWPNLADPSVPEDVARLVVRAAVATVCDSTGYARWVLTDMVQVTAGAATSTPDTKRTWWSRLTGKTKSAPTVKGDPDDETNDEPDDDVLEEPGQDEPTSSPTAVWATGWAGLAPVSALRWTLKDQLAGAAGAQVMVDHRSRGGAGAVFFGACTDPATVFDEHQGITIEQLIDLEREDEWRVRWAAALKQGTNAPRPELTHYNEERMVGRPPATLHYLPFVTLNGEEPEQYFGLEAKLKATLNGAPFVAITGFAGREGNGQRHAQAFEVTWSDSPVPAGPQALAPQRQGTVARRILAGRINEAFTAARLARPEVRSVTCLTDERSRGHIWAIDVRLYGGVTLSDVRGAVARIRGSLASPWLRVAAAEDGCVIYAGERTEKVKLADEVRTRPQLIALDWEQAWLDSKVSGVGGLLPKLTATDVLPRNDKVQVLDFALPSGVAISDVKAATEKLKTSTGNAFIDVRTGPAGPSTVRLLVCEVNPLPDSAPYDFMAIDGSKGIPFATGIDGEEITYNPRVDPHLLVAGASGGGKSVTLQAVIYGALIRGWDVYVADPTKGAADFKFAAPYVKSMTVDPFEAAAMMKAVYAEVVRRKNLNSEYGVGNYRDLPDAVRPAHMLVVIDEFTSLMGQDPVPRPSDDPDMDAEREIILAGNQAKTEIGVYTGKCAREARSAGLTLVLATQKLAAKLLDTIPGAGDLKVNLSRMLLGKATMGDRQSALRQPFEAPELGDSVPPGRGLWETTEGAAKVMQAWYDPREQAVLVEELAARLTPLAAEDHLDLDTFRGKRPDEEQSRTPRAPAAPKVIELAPIVLTLDDLEAMVAEEDSEDAQVLSDLDALNAPVETDEPLDVADVLAQMNPVPVTDTVDAAEDDLFQAALAELNGVVPPTWTDTPDDGAEVPAPVDSLTDTVVLLGVDGVLAPMGPSRAWEDLETMKVKAGHVLASRAALAAVGALPSNIVWASDWQGSAQPSFGPSLGREHVEHLSPAPGHTDHGWWKIGAAQAWLAEHPEVRRVVWVDDRLDNEDDLGVPHRETIEDLLALSGVELLTVSPDSMIGLTREHVETIGAFLRADDQPAAPTPAPSLPVPAPAAPEPTASGLAPEISEPSAPERPAKPKTYVDEW